MPAGHVLLQQIRTWGTQHVRVEIGDAIDFPHAPGLAAGRLVLAGLEGEQG